MHWRRTSCRRLSSARATRPFFTVVPRRGRRGTRSLRGTVLKRWGPDPTSPNALVVKIGPGSNPLEEMGRVEDLTTEMRTAGMTLDDHMLYTNFIDALPAEYEVEERNLASHYGIGRDDIIKAVRERHHRLSGSRKKGSNAGHAGHAVFARGDDGGRRKGAGGGVHGKGGGRGKGKGGRRGQQGRGGNGTNEDASGLAAAAGGDGSSAKTAEGDTSEVRCHRCSKKGHWRVDCTEELCSQCHGRQPDVCPTSKEEAVPVVTDDDDYDDAVEASASKTGERQASAVMVWAERGKGSRLGR